jgi:hypothetical protein
MSPCLTTTRGGQPTFHPSFVSHLYSPPTHVLRTQDVVASQRATRPAPARMPARRMPWRRWMLCEFAALALPAVPPRHFIPRARSRLPHRQHTPRCSHGRVCSHAPQPSPDQRSSHERSCRRVDASRPRPRCASPRLQSAPPPDPAAVNPSLRGRPRLWRSCEGVKGRTPHRRMGGGSEETTLGS